MPSTWPTARAISAKSEELPGELFSLPRADRLLDKKVVRPLGRLFGPLRQRARLVGDHGEAPPRVVVGQPGSWVFPARRAGRCEEAAAPLDGAVARSLPGTTGPPRRRAGGPSVRRPSRCPWAPGIHRHGVAAGRRLHAARADLEDVEHLVHQQADGEELARPSGAFATRVGEYPAGHLPGAINAPILELDGFLARAHATRAQHPGERPTHWSFL